MRFAVVLKAFGWDAFIARQAERCRAATGSGDFFIVLDDTAGSIVPVAFPHVVRISERSVLAAGFSPRTEEGAMLWWNADYAHYAFQEAHPDYDNYVFVEYDAQILGSIQAIVEKAALGRVDLIALPIKSTLASWRWTVLHRQTYSAGDLDGALVCISLFSRRALEMLGRRRREMAEVAAVPFWPSAEVFVPTEVRLAGMVARSLSDFGDVDRYDAFPPMTEGSLVSVPQVGRTAFFHPVLDHPRYAASLLRVSPFIDFVKVGSELYRGLRQADPRPPAGTLARAALKRFGDAIRDRRRRLRVQLFGKLVGAQPDHRHAWHSVATLRSAPPAGVCAGNDRAVTESSR